MSGPLVADLGLGPGVWLFLSLVGCLTLFFKFGRLWSVRNLDLLLLFAPAPGLMRLVGSGVEQPWWAFVGLFAGALLWILRCLIDLGLARRPMLEPNLSSGGMAFLATSLLGLMALETVQVPVAEGAARNPADPRPKADATARRAEASSAPEATVNHVIGRTPLPVALRRMPPRVALARLLALLGHIGLVIGLVTVGRVHFGRPTSGMAVAVAYLVLPYARIALVDTGQIVPAALIVAALVVHARPAAAGALIGVASGWNPAAIGLLPLWAGYYGGRLGLRFLAVAAGVIALGVSLAWARPALADWALALGARSLDEVGLLPRLDAPRAGSFWTEIDPSYRLPVLIAYLAFVLVTAVWPAGKDLGELIALSAALLAASQFWYLDEGGTLVVLYLPLILLMVFRPTLAAQGTRAPAARGAAPPTG